MKLDDKFRDRAYAITTIAHQICYTITGNSDALTPHEAIVCLNMVSSMVQAEVQRLDAEKYAVTLGPKYQVTFPENSPLVGETTL